MTTDTPASCAESAPSESATYAPLAAHLRRGDYAVRKVDLTTCRELVAAFHYTGRGSNTGVAMHGLFRADDFMTCLGVAWWLPTTRSAAEATWPSNWRGVLNLSRLVLDPDVPTNGASYLLGRSIRLVRADRRWECLVTYADEAQGHTGAIYRATNWTYVGVTRVEPIWQDSHGRTVARKSGPRTRTNAEMTALGYLKVGSSRKHKFVMPLVGVPLQQGVAA